MCYNAATVLDGVEARKQAFMLVVISDLHFEEEISYTIPAGDGQEPVRFTRNLPAKAFARFVSGLAAEAIRNKARRLDLVFAGDIFEITRTPLWWEGAQMLARPFLPANQAGPETDARVLHILEAIAAPGGTVNEALAVFQRLGRGFYIDLPQMTERAFPVPVHLHFLPGNHDRHANGTPAIRRKVRQLLGMPDSAAPFPNAIPFQVERTLVRHGHEYDYINFNQDLRGQERIPLHLNSADYMAAPVGDFVALNFAARLGPLFRSYHSDEGIRRDPLLRRVYLRILEFDDLRPQSAALNFMLNIPNLSFTHREIWSRALEPVAKLLLDELHDHPFLLTWLDRLDKKWQLDTVDIVQGVLKLQPWSILGVPLGVLQEASDKALSTAETNHQAVALAARESVIQTGEMLYVVAGHTHRPEVALLKSDQHGERYYVDTGTWRNRVLATADYTGFGRQKALTYVTIYGPDEDQGNPPQPGKISSVDYWYGLTQRWPST